MSLTPHPAREQFREAKQTDVELLPCLCIVAVCRTCGATVAGHAITAEESSAEDIGRIAQHAFRYRIEVIAGPARIGPCECPAPVIAAKAAELFAPAAASQSEIESLAESIKGHIARGATIGYAVTAALVPDGEKIIADLNAAARKPHWLDSDEIADVIRRYLPPAAAEVVQGGEPTFEALMETINETPRIGHLLAADKFELAKRIAALFGVHRCIECGGRGKVLDLDGHLDSQWIPCSTCAPPATTTASGGEIRVDGRVCHFADTADSGELSEWMITDKPFGQGGKFLRADGTWGDLEDSEFTNFWPTESEARTFAQQHADPIQAPSSERTGGR